MNHFFAIEVPQEARQYIQEQVVAFWKPALKESTRWYPPEDYHVTLKFLGDVPEVSIGGVVTAALPIAAQIKPFDLILAPPGAFPAGGPRIFWMGVGRNNGINSLAAALGLACEKLGFESEDRMYTPHITVARTLRGRGRESVSNAPVLDEHLFPYWQVKQFALMQTLPPDRRANGANARYNTVHTFPFGDRQLSAGR